MQSGGLGPDVGMPDMRMLNKYVSCLVCHLLREGKKEVTGSTLSCERLCPSE